MSKRATAPRPPSYKRCKYCRARFEVKRTSGKPQAFCSATHRKLYWQYGALPFHKTIERIEKQTRAILAAELAPLKITLTALALEVSELRQERKTTE